MDKTQIHVIDDDLGIFELLKDFFEDTPFYLTASNNPQKGIDYVKNNDVALVILDLMMPVMDGFEACRKLREYNSEIPIIMLTAKKSDYDKIVGLELGADDYVQKPFNPRELLARIKTILRRSDKSIKKIPEINIIHSKRWDIKIDLNSRTVSKNSKIIDFTATEFELLKYLMENFGIVQSREVLMDRMRGIDLDSFDRTIDVFISKIRHKLGDNPKDSEIIKTVRSIGYIFPEL